VSCRKEARSTCSTKSDGDSTTPVIVGRSVVRACTDIAHVCAICASAITSSENFRRRYASSSTASETSKSYALTISVNPQMPGITGISDDGAVIFTIVIPSIVNSKLYRSQCSFRSHKAVNGHPLRRHTSLKPSSWRILQQSPACDVTFIGFTNWRLSGTLLSQGDVMQQQQSPNLSSTDYTNSNAN
jgi:hypothetical protein